MPLARFDDLRAGQAWVFPAPARELIATKPEDVLPVLAEVEQATADGWWAYGFVAYEAAPGVDPGLAVHEAVDGLPLAWFGISAEPARQPLICHPAPNSYRITTPWQLQWTADVHRQRVETVHSWIAAGETYQCNLTTRLTGSLSGDPLACYADLALAQGGSYNAYLEVLGRFVVASASPELFFEIRGDELFMRPMKGTARRGDTAAEDAALVAALRASPKERAENIMIVDLVRNDLSRISTTGGVRVHSLCDVEQYKTVHQLTSDVSARLKPKTDLAEVFRALFPCGSVTGAPKRRTMQLIRELEDGPRGVYCGAIGMVAPAGAPTCARFNVAIRTLLIDRESGIATYGTGGGITWDSDPAAEYAELQAKTAVLTQSRGYGAPFEKVLDGPSVMPDGEEKSS